MAYDHISDKGFISTEDFLVLPRMSCLDCKRIGQNVLFINSSVPSGYACPQCGSPRIAKLTEEFKPIEGSFVSQEKTQQEKYIEQEKRKVKSEKPKKEKPKSSEPRKQVKMKKKQEQIGMFK